MSVFMNPILFLGGQEMHDMAKKMVDTQSEKSFGQKNS